MMPAAAPSALHRVGDERRRQGAGHLVDVHARAQEHRDDLVVEGLGPVARVAADDDPARGSTPISREPRHDPLGRAAHGAAVHPGRARAITGPRSPAVPKVSGASKRRCSSASSPSSRSAASVGAVGLVGVGRDPRAHARQRVRRSQDRDRVGPAARPATAAAFWPASRTSRWSSGAVGDPGGEVRHQTEAQHLGAEVARGDRLEHRRHPHERRAHRARHRDLGGRLVVRTAKARVDALAQARARRRAPRRAGARCRDRSGRRSATRSRSGGASPSIGRGRGQVDVVPDHDDLARDRWSGRCRRRRW